jgi:hypothetical protein
VRQPLRSLNLHADAEYQELPLGTIIQSRFLKSRVYAKLPRRLIVKRYQTFNGYPSQLGKGMHNIVGLTNRQTAQSICIRQGLDDTSFENASG